MNQWNHFNTSGASSAPQGIEGYDSLVELALDMRWSWSHYADDLWRRLDSKLWEQTQNPWVVLQTVSRDVLVKALRDSDFRGDLESLLADLRGARDEPAWFQQNHPASPLTRVAYFSMEFMLSEALPIYSGGLGNVAGDQLKAASDLGVPVVGVGLLYQQGYFRQVIDAAGGQEALYPYNDPGQLPVAPLRQPNGEWLRIEIDLPGSSVWLRTWRVQVGRAELYLLDSNDAANLPAHRGITSELYGGGPELRLQQEIILGIGGWRLLTALGIRPEVCHLNEGHAAFAVLERARECVVETALPFETALTVTRAGNHFTTHTAVAAGFDRFSPSLVEQYLGDYAGSQLGIPVQELLAMGRQNPWDASEPFNMAHLAIHGSGSVNGVSRLHGEVSRALFEPLFPRWPTSEVPVGYVTNGVHMPSWDSAASDELWTEACGKERWLGETDSLGDRIREVPAARLWQFRATARATFVEYVRDRAAHQLAIAGDPRESVDGAKSLLNPDILTLGFARRFATYKRPNLLLHDPERLLRLLTSTERPVQLVMAGKAHPADWAGQELIRAWIHFIRRPEAARHVVFLTDYDMQVTEQMVRGVDVWLNMPRRPWEASGTSGMKVLVNGGINLSELDGWWAEAYAPEVGWAMGDGAEHGDDPAWDDAEANALYELLERQVVPEFYSRDEAGVPQTWVSRMRESMARLTPQFSANRAVREYTEDYYLPAASGYLRRSENGAANGKEIAEWLRTAAGSWNQVRFGDFRVQTTAGRHEFEVQVHLGEVNPASVRVELYADGYDGATAERWEMKSTENSGSPGPTNYRVEIAANRPAGDFTPRVIPHHDSTSVPLEISRILWQR